MCVIFFYVNSNPKENGYKLILASNRDEFYARDTKEAAKWEDVENCYGGIDMEPGREGGTWLAISGQDGIFKIAALLNLTGEPKPRNAVGRGMLVSDYVRNYTEGFDNVSYNRQLMAECSKYSAFNFVSVEIGSPSHPALVTLCSNVPPGLVQYKENTCYGFGNSLPSAPFEKVRNGRNRFEKIVEDFQQQEHPEQSKLIDQLMQLLKCKEKFWPDAELKRRAPNWGEYLSSLNVSVPGCGYGSRTHTVILVDAHNKMHFIEETMKTEDPEGEWSRHHIETQFSF
ncbi:transport and golgi organization 2 isoform X3 [Haematobia irritans]|uniref:transport and golgi organization 2 isoform X3 n=1 Tax=Haematobia irritans TaxID=7368 RepID=UPI003F504A6D